MWQVQRQDETIRKGRLTIELGRNAGYVSKVKGEKREKKSREWTHCLEIRGCGLAKGKYWVGSLLDDGSGNDDCMDQENTVKRVPPILEDQILLNSIFCSLGACSD